MGTSILRGGSWGFDKWRGLADALLEDAEGSAVKAEAVVDGEAVSDAGVNGTVNEGALKVKAPVTVKGVN